MHGPRLKYSFYSQKDRTFHVFLYLHQRGALPHACAWPNYGSGFVRPYVGTARFVVLAAVTFIGSTAFEEMSITLSLPPSQCTWFDWFLPHGAPGQNCWVDQICGPRSIFYKRLQHWDCGQTEIIVRLV